MNAVLQDESCILQASGTGLKVSTFDQGDGVRNHNGFVVVLVDVLVDVRQWLEVAGWYRFRLFRLACNSFRLLLLFGLFLLYRRSISELLRCFQ